MPSLNDALSEVRGLLLEPGLIRAVGAGRRRGQAPSVARATLRQVNLKSGVSLQLVTDDGARPTTENLPLTGSDRLDEILAEPFGNWHVETETGTLQLRVTKKGDALRHWSAGAASGSGDRSHDRAKEHLLDPGDPIFEVIGGNAAKRRQVDAFLRQLATADLPEQAHLVDLGCGNAYLTFAAYAYLSRQGRDVRLTGVDVRADQRERNTALARELGWSDRVEFVAGTIAEAEISTKVDVVLALHACDTATDDALARAVGWEAKWIFAAPCCHKDLSRQLRRRPPAGPYRLMTASGILRERFADVLTDTLRAAILAEHGYTVEVVEFIDSAHTPRNALIRARRSLRSGDDGDLPGLLEQWQVRPHLLDLLS